MRQTDPQAAGEWLLEKRQDGALDWLSFSELADVIPWEHLPEVDKNDSLCKETVARYRKELEEREDRYAKSVLEGINAGIGVVGYDDAGN
jgi:hypothetical protein